MTERRNSSIYARWPLQVETLDSRLLRAAEREPDENIRGRLLHHLVVCDQCNKKAKAQKR